MVTIDAPSWATLRTLMPTQANAATAVAHAASAPLWTLDGLRAADPVLGLALLMLVALLLAEMLHRTWRIPRICGHMLTGAIAGPVMLRLFEGLELDPWKPLIDLAIGAHAVRAGHAHPPALAARQPLARRRAACCSRHCAARW